MPIMLILYKEDYYSTTNLENSLPSVAISLSQEFEDVFPEEMPINYHLYEASNIKLISSQKPSFLIDQPIEVVQKKERNFKGKSRSC